MRRILVWQMIPRAGGFLSKQLQAECQGVQGHPASVGSAVSVRAIGRSFPHRKLDPFISENLVIVEKVKVFFIDDEESISFGAQSPRGLKSMTIMADRM